jgi:coronin-1B/1C/6
VVYLTGKGDGNMRIYELKHTTTELFPLSEFKSSVAAKGMAFVPRNSLDFSSIHWI